MWRWHGDWWVTAASRDSWTLAALWGLPRGLKHSQDFPAQLHVIVTLWFTAVHKPQSCPSLAPWELYALRMHYCLSPRPCTVRQIRIITAHNENISEQAPSLMTSLHEI